jgi:Domain of unknown function (DUF5615)
MKLLLDECVTRKLGRECAGHDVFTVEEAGFKGLKNGALLRRAVAEGFEVLVTVDQSLSHQQNLRSLRIAVLILAARKNTYAALKPLVPRALRALARVRRGEVVRVESAPEAG